MISIRCLSPPVPLTKVSVNPDRRATSRPASVVKADIRRAWRNERALSPDADHRQSQQLGTALGDPVHNSQALVGEVEPQVVGTVGRVPRRLEVRQHGGVLPVDVVLRLLNRAFDLPYPLGRHHVRAPVTPLGGRRRARSTGSRLTRMVRQRIGRIARRSHGSPY